MLRYFIVTQSVAILLSKGANRSAKNRYGDIPEACGIKQLASEVSALQVNPMSTNARPQTYRTVISEVSSQPSYLDGPQLSTRRQEESSGRLASDKGLCTRDSATARHTHAGKKSYSEY